MKTYERAEAGRKLMPLVPALARIDGRGFSRFAEGLERPYDARLSRMMIETTRFLVSETGARVGYTQSDEISLVWHEQDPKKEIFFGGRIQKMVSVLAALATVELNRQLTESMPDYAAKRPVFDCRVWSVPTLEEAANALLWREQDATKNSISMAARACFDHEALMGKSGADKQDMLHSRGINWNDYPAFFKRGTYVARREVRIRGLPPNLEALPARHRARTEPEFAYARTEVRALEMPPLSRVTNRVAALFEGVEASVGD